MEVLNGAANDISILGYTLLLIVGFSAGFVDSVAGGGGIITLPALISVGLPPQLALGTNKLQSSFGSFSSSMNYIRKGAVNLKETVLGVLCTLVGASLGAWAVQQIDASFLSKMIPFLLTAILFYILFTPQLGKIERDAKISSPLFFLIFGLTLGFYDGFFGPGTGSFWTVLIMVLLGSDMVKATAITKTMNFTSNVVSLIVFTIGGCIVLKVGLIMAAGQIGGALLGSGMVVKKGTKFIKPIFLTVVAIMVITMFYKNYFS